MKIKYKFSLSQEWTSDNIEFTERVFERNDLDMSQVLDILNDFEIFTSKYEVNKREIVYWLLQNERNFALYGEGCVNNRTIVLCANLNHNMNDVDRNVANNYTVGFDDENSYRVQVEITALSPEE